MKNIFFYSKHDFPMNLQKINSCLYYDLQKDTFYRLNVMPHCTTFVSEDVEQREVLSLTRYDINFHMINLLFKQRKVKFEDLPHYLQKRNWNSIASQESAQGKVVYNFEKKKIFDFLQKKVAQMEKYIDKKNPLDRLNFIKNQEKTASQDTILLLKNELDSDFLSQFVKERYNLNQNRKIAPQPVDNEVIKPKILAKNKKPTSVSKPIQIPKNQGLLFNSWKKK